MRANKIMKMTDNTWMRLVIELAKEFEKEYEEIDSRLKSIMKSEGIKKVQFSNKNSDNIFEVVNDPIRKAHTLYNYDAFKNDYKLKLIEHMSKFGMMR